MTDWMRDDPEDLVIGARRGSLSEAEQRHLERELASSGTLRAAYQVGTAFDAIAAMRRGDEHLIRQWVDEISQSVPERPARRSRRLIRVWLAAGIVSLLSGAALGWHLVTQSPAETAEGQASPRAQPAASLQKKKSNHGRERFEDEPAEQLSAPDSPDPQVDPRETGGVQTDEVPQQEGFERGELDQRRTPEPEQTPSSSGSASALSLARQGDPSVAGDPESSARSLFAQANSAWRAGEHRRAAGLYQELQQRFSRSGEAMLSHLSLGRVWMALGRHETALQEFRAYRGPLAEEALLGQARALKALGRSAAEASVWRLLLSRHPESVYERQARQRLRELDK